MKLGDTGFSPTELVFGMGGSVSSSYGEFANSHPTFRKCTVPLKATANVMGVTLLHVVRFVESLFLVLANYGLSWSSYNFDAEDGKSCGLNCLESLVQLLATPVRILVDIPLLAKSGYETGLMGRENTKIQSSIHGFFEQ